jgi:hypothetical protein
MAAVGVGLVCWAIPSCRDALGDIAKGISDWAAPAAKGAACPTRGLRSDSTGDSKDEGEERVRGLPPEGVAPPVAEPDKLEAGPASRPSEQQKGGQSLWDADGGEWRYAPEDKWHNPHWDYNPHDAPKSPWENVPIGNLPPRK